MEPEGGPFAHSEKVRNTVEVHKNASEKQRKSRVMIETNPTVHNSPCPAKNLRAKRTRVTSWLQLCSCGRKNGERKRWEGQANTVTKSGRRVKLLYQPLCEEFSEESIDSFVEIHIPCPKERGRIREMKASRPLQRSSPLGSKSHISELI